MLVALYDGSDVLNLYQKDLRRLNSYEVLLKVSACGVCGTDIKILKGESHSNPPVVIGHEFCGHIEEMGKDVTTLSKGDFVSVDPNINCGYCRFCRSKKSNLCSNLKALGVDIDGGFAEYCIVPERQCYKLSKDIAPSHAAMLEPLSCALHGIQIAEIAVGDTVLIIGAGIIGIIMLKLAILSGASNVLVSDVDEKRRLFARSVGADYIIDPNEIDVTKMIKDITEGGPEVVIECVGSTASTEKAIEYVRDGGKVIIFGVSPIGEKISISPYEIFRRGLVIKGSFINPYTFAPSVELMNSKRIDFDDIDIKSFSLNRIFEAFDNHVKRRSLKTIVELE